MKELVDAGHKVSCETNAGAAPPCPTKITKRRAREIVGSAADVWKKADMVVKVKEPHRGGVSRYFREAWCCSPTCTSPPIPELTEALLSEDGRRHRLRDHHATATARCRC